MRAVVFFFVLMLLPAAPVSAGELPDSVRRMAERAFLQGRLDDLDDILAAAEEPIDRLPLILRDEWWRTTLPRPEHGWGGGESLAARRTLWVVAPDSGVWPLPEAGGSDPYPILTALIQDRAWRESRGHEGLPQDGPLNAIAAKLDPKRERRAAWFLGTHSNHMMSVAYRGVPPHEDAVAAAREAAADREAEDLRARNGSLAAIILGVFLLLPLLAAGLLRRRTDASASE